MAGRRAPSLRTDTRRTILAVLVLGTACFRLVEHRTVPSSREALERSAAGA